MATSGSVDFSVSRDNLIEAALRLSGVLDPESGSATATQLSKGAEALNMLVKAWHADGMPLWAIKKSTITLLTDTNSYTVTSLGITRPIRIIKAYRTDTTSSTDTPMNIITRDEYVQLGNKTSSGPPVDLYYDPQLTDALATIYMYPRPSSTDATTYTVTIYYQRPFEDFDASADTPDFPQEWYQAIKWNLAVNLAYEYGVPDSRLDRIERRAMFEHQKVLDMGQEEGSIYFMPDQRMFGG